VLQAERVLVVGVLQAERVLVVGVLRLGVVEQVSYLLGQTRYRT